MTNRRRYKGQLICWAALALATANPVAAVDRSNTLVPRTYFGMHVHRADAGTQWPGMEIGTWRLWDAGVAWLNLETERAQWDFKRLDRYVDMASQRDVDINYAFGLTPAWASARPQEKGVYRPGDAAEPKLLADWRTYVSEVANRYRGRVRTYELWNEVNAGTGYFTGSQQALLELQKAAYAIVKSVDPEAVFASPSSVGEAEHQLAWFERYLALGGGRHADVISYHFYQPSKRPEAILGLVQRVNAAMRRQGVGGKPLWNTESGYAMELGKARVGAASPSWPLLSPQRAEAYVSRVLVLGWWAGLDRFYWYAWDNGDLGFLGKSGAVTPAGRAYLTMARWMVGSRVSSCGAQNEIWTCALQRDGRRAWMVWNSADQEVEWSTAHLPEVTMQESISGVLEPLTASQVIMIDGTPRLLVDGTAPWSDGYRRPRDVLPRGSLEAPSIAHRPWLD